MPQPAIRCVELVELVTEWMEGALSDDDRVQVEEHFAICPHCTDYLTQIRRSVDTVRLVSRDAPPTAVRDALLREFRRASRDSPTGQD